MHETPHVQPPVVLKHRTLHGIRFHEVARGETEAEETSCPCQKWIIALHDNAPQLATAAKTADLKHRIKKYR